MPMEYNDYLEHYGVKGMKWGQRRDGVSRSATRKANKDAAEFTKAKMFYGESAGTRRKLIKAKVEERKKHIPGYADAFDKAVGSTDMAQRANQAVRARKTRDVKNSTKRTIRGVGHVIKGNTQYASMTAITLMAAGGVAYRAGGDRYVKEYGRRAYSAAKNLKQNPAVNSWLKRNGFG